MTLIERVARAWYASRAAHNGILLPWERLDPQKDIAPMLEHARAALLAMREPTEAMILAGRTVKPFQAPMENWTLGQIASNAVWYAMIDSALSEKTP